MLEIFDRNRRRIAIAENACAVTETQRLNSIWSLSFSLPYEDPKNEFCKPFYYVRHDNGELYRIMPSAFTVDETGGYTYQCEHVLATLIDNVLHDYNVYGGHTVDVIRYILDKQLVKNWVLEECDYNFQFEYGWENESLLSALFSVSTPFADPYIWRTNTSGYPWKLSLKRLETSGTTELYVRRAYNMMQLQSKSDPQKLTTRLYPLGYGEGVNQLTIKDVNNGVPYLQSPSNIVAKYGIVERVWIDRRYEDPETLKAVGQAILKGLQEPRVTYDIGFQELPAAGQAKAAPGLRLRIICPELKKTVDTYVTEVTRTFGDWQQSTITVANQPEDIAASIADLMDKQRIEQAYAQGATQLYSQALQANGSPEHGVIMDFFIPEEMRIINGVFAKIRIDKFRAYSKATTTVEQEIYTEYTESTTAKTTSSGGGEYHTGLEQHIDAGRNYFNTSYAQFGEETTGSRAFGNGTEWATSKSWSVSSENNEKPHTHKISWEHHHPFNSHHRHYITDHHTHTVKQIEHTHKFTMNNHRHNYTIPSHYHIVNIPAHSHEITPGIYKFGNPENFSIYINGSKKQTLNTLNTEINLTNLLIGNKGKIPRNKWFSIEIRPNDLAYISIVLVIQGFVQSRGDIHA